jgi:hypothetical protein
MYNIGDTVKYKTYSDNLITSVKTGTITEVCSDKDSYVNLCVENDVIQYFSKKLKRYVPVKPKNMGSIYFTIPQRLCDDFVLVEDILREA